MSIKLEPKAKQGYKWWSVQIMTLILVLELLQQILPMWSDVIPADWQGVLTPALVTLAMIARFIHQELPKDD